MPHELRCIGSCCHAIPAPPLPPSLAQLQPEIMEEIRDETHLLQDSDAAEPRWSRDVHFMMLRQVCMHLPGIQQQNITSARPNPKERRASVLWVGVRKGPISQVLTVLVVAFHALLVVDAASVVA